MELQFNSVETIANLNALAAFQVDSGKVFKEDTDIVPVIIDKNLSYVPWGGDNNMPYHILELIESDETLATCQQFNAEVCYGSGLNYVTDECSAAVKQQVEDFLLDNAMAQYWLGVCHDFKHFAFCVSVIIGGEADSQGGVLLPTLSCGEGRQHQISSLRQLAQRHRFA